MTRFTSLAAERLFRRMQQRCDAFHRQADGAEHWARYGELVERLPHLLRHNGLRLSLQYLHRLALARGEVAAGALLADWLGTGGALTGVHLCHALPAAGATPPTGSAARRLSERLGAHEAALMKTLWHGVQPPESVGAERAEPVELPDLPRWGPSLPQELQCHPGLAWRFGADIDPVSPRDHRAGRAQQVLGALRARGATHRDAYRLVYQRRRGWLSRIACCTDAAGLVDLAFINLGDRGVFETQAELGIATGMPVIPASALRHALRESLCNKVKAQADPDHQRAMRELVGRLLGTPSHAGRLVVHDAWSVPDEPTTSGPGPLVPDVDTPHHPDYYRGRQDKALPTDSPEPNPQWAVRGRFLLAVGDSVEGAAGWAPRGLRWLWEALTCIGVGGRRRAGAGRFTDPPRSPPAPPAPPALRPNVGAPSSHGW